ncbi:MAG TPA: hypothetical protein V6D20_02860 [Candidatus Obscuribacterales bacterium]
MGGAVSHYFEKGAELVEGLTSCAVRRELDGTICDSMDGHKLIQGLKEALATGDSHGCMLELASDGFEIGEGAMLFASEFGNGGLYLGDLCSWELNGAVEPIHDPPQDLFSNGPHPFAFEEFLLGDWVIGNVSEWGTGEDLMDGVQEGSGVVAEDFRVLALDESNVVIDEDLQ